MGYPQKTLYAVGCTAKEEGSYLGGGSLSVSTDGVQLALSDNRRLPVVYQVDFDGMKSVDLAARAPLARLAPSARYLAGIELPFHWKGFGAAYSASNKPNLHAFFKAAGLDAVGSFTGGSEKWTYSPFGTGSAVPTSLVINLYTGEERWPLTGVFCTYRRVSEGGKPPMHFLKVWGVLGDPVEDDGGAEALTIVYPTLTIDPPKSDAMVFALGSFVTPDVVRSEFELGWGDPTTRQLVSQAGFHGGFARDLTLQPRLRVTLEQTALVGSPFHTSAGLDPYQLYKAATKLTGSVVSEQCGSAQYNRLKTIFAQAQMSAIPTLDNTGSIQTVTVEFAPYGSTPVTGDALSLVAD